MSSTASLHAAALTDKGRVRTHNEDFVLVRDDLGLFAVADGAGGHRSGDVAAALALRSLSNYVGATVRATHDKPDFDPLGIPHQARRLSAGIHKANRDIVEVSRSSAEHRGMGTTIAALLFAPRTGALHLAHVGDSRCYRLRAGELELLTRDHTIGEVLLASRPDLDDARVAKLGSNVVTRALGMNEELEVSVRTLTPRSGDRYILCTDGLSTPVPHTEIHDLASSGDAPHELVARLVEAANRRGGPDNVAAVVMDVEFAFDDDESPTLVYDRDSSLPFSEEFLPRGAASNPELLITGIQDFDEDAPRDQASDDFLSLLVRLTEEPDEEDDP